MPLPVFVHNSWYRGDNFDALRYASLSFTTLWYRGDIFDALRFAKLRFAKLHYPPYLGTIFAPSAHVCPPKLPRRNRPPDRHDLSESKRVVVHRSVSGDALRPTTTRFASLRFAKLPYAILATFSG